MKKCLFLVFLLFCILLGGVASNFGAKEQEISARHAQVNKVEMEKTEELSESLANNLLDFSVAARNRNLAEMGKWIEETLLATELPSLERYSPQWTRGSLQQGDLLLKDSLINFSETEWLEHWQHFVDPFKNLRIIFSFLKLRCFQMKT